MRRAIRESLLRDRMLRSFFVQIEKVLVETGLNLEMSDSTKEWSEKCPEGAVVLRA